jgi:two-component system, OmpR family, sensor kinase
VPRPARTKRRLVLDLAVVLGVVGAVLTLLARTRGADPDVASAASLVMAGLAVSAGSAAAVTMLFAARLTGSARITWVGVLVGVYSLLAIPISTAHGLDMEHPPLPAAGIVLVHVLSVLLLLLVLVPPSPRTTTRLLWSLLGAVPPLVVGVLLWVTLSPASAAAGSRPWWLACALVWMLGGLVIVGRASRDRVQGLAVAGAGFAMLGAAQAAWFFIPSSGAEAGPLFGALRLVAVVGVLCGSIRILRGALLRLGVEQALTEEELRRAELLLVRAAERDHDLRNGLAGLAGATVVLGGGGDTGALSRIVAGELRRLDGMLAQTTCRDDDARGSYAVAPALEGLVMLRRSVGMDVRADVEPCLCAVGAPSTLAQVVTNLLANAERHAPGSPVHIAARRRDSYVEIRVRDFGPGVRPGRERAVLEPGACDERAGGAGLGLHVCRMLLAAEDATIEILPAEARSPGCVVVLRLPMGERAFPERPQFDRDTSPARC